jgi:hypothetical protein
MPLNIAARFSFCAFASIALLSGCANGSAPSAPQVSAAQLVTNAGSPTPAMQNTSWMYTAQLYGNDAEIYLRKGPKLTPHGKIKGLSSPSGMFTTPNGYWYIANGGGANAVIYKSTNKARSARSATSTTQGGFRTTSRRLRVAALSLSPISRRPAAAPAASASI